MTSVALRRTTASRVASMIRDERGRQILDTAGWRTGAPVIVALPEDTVGEMWKKIVEAESPAPAILAVPAIDGLTILSFSPVEHGHPLPPNDEHSIGSESTVGMLVDYLEMRPNRQLTFRMTWTRLTISRGQLVDA